PFTLQILVDGSTDRPTRSLAADDCRVHPQFFAQSISWGPRHARFQSPGDFFRENLAWILWINFFPMRRSQHPNDRQGKSQKCAQKHDHRTWWERFLLRDSGRI